MADYKVEVDLSDLFDDMTISEQKSFLVDKFCSLPLGSMEEVAGEMLENVDKHSDVYDWNALVYNFDITKWLYIEDLFPKEGGENG